MIRRFLLSAATIAASAAGVAVSAPAMAQEQASPWSGFYVGANVGGSWANNKLRTQVTPGPNAGALPGIDAAAISAASPDTSNKSGFTGGVQGGYNYLIGSQWFIGGEVDYEGMDIRSAATKQVASTVVPGVVYTVDESLSSGWLITLRPRAGYIYNNFLFYGSIGFAWADLKYQAALSTNTGLPRLAAESNSTRTGFAGGVGLAYAFNPHWSTRAEWLYADLGHANSANVQGTYATVRADDNIGAQLVRVGLDYRF